MQRGNITVWISDQAIANWYCIEKTGRKGSSDTYSEMAVETCLMIRNLFRLGLRQSQGFVNSLLVMAGIDLQSPDYTTLSRRLAGLRIDLGAKNLTDKLYVVVDSTGVKVYGEGEWKVRTHGWQKRRTWRKRHVCIDSETQQILSVETTENNVADAERLEDLLDGVPPDKEIEKVAADGIYDNRKSYDAINKPRSKSGHSAA